VTGDTYRLFGTGDITECLAEKKIKGTDDIIECWAHGIFIDTLAHGKITECYVTVDN